MIKVDGDKSTASKQLKLKQLDSGLLVIKFDSPQKANHLTSSVIAEFEEVIKQIEQDSSIKAVALFSAKHNSFLLGADLREIMQLKSEEAALKLVSRGQEIFSRFAALSKPTIAAIHGTCLGGGLELALCCHKRLATPSKYTLLGLPETRLGFVPGLGGTQRLPRLVGLKNAVDLILSAEPIHASKALEIGLIDQIVIEEELEKQVEVVAAQLVVDSNLKPVDKQYADWHSADEKRDQTLFKASRRAVNIITKGNYPAQSQALDVIEEGIKSGLRVGLEQESKTFARLAVSDISRNLVFLFFNAELVKQAALAATEKENLSVIKTVGIIGGGMMGINLAKLIAEDGYKVLFRTFNKERAEKAFADLEEEIQKNKLRKSIDDSNIDLSLVRNDKDFEQADIIIEAIEEKLPTKISLFKQLETVVKPECLFSTITSSLSVTSMAEELNSEIPIIGAHFFHPVDKMPLVEIALPLRYGKELEQKYRQSNAKLSQFVAELGKTPIFVKDSPCFLVNRLLASYLLESARLAQAGVPLSWMDKAAVDFGMPIGPLTLLDEIGFDLVLSVAGTLADKFPNRIVLPDVLNKVSKLGMKGKRFGCGVYLWENGKRLNINPRLINEIGLSDSDKPPASEESIKIAAALILPMIDEAAHCLEEKVIRRAREIDISSVLGLGFPAFRGGILKYADSLGLPEVVDQLNHIYSRTKPGRKVSNLLNELAQKNGKFY